MLLVSFRLHMLVEQPVEHVLIQQIFAWIYLITHASTGRSIIRNKIGEIQGHEISVIAVSARRKALPKHSFVSRVLIAKLRPQLQGR